MVIHSGFPRHDKVGDAFGDHPNRVDESLKSVFLCFIEGCCEWNLAFCGESI
jgi:hypothetical protein